MGLEGQTFDFLERCEVYESAGQILDDLLACLRPFGFESLILSGVPVGNEPLEPLVVLNAWPTEWFRRYTRLNYASTDVVCRRCTNATKPFFWHDLPEAVYSTQAKRVFGEAAEFGLVSGYVVPMRAVSGWHSVISMASPFKHLDLSKRELAAIHMMAAIAGDAVYATLSPVEPEKALSRREREVLQWIARGKTPQETAAILSVSIATVRKHLENLRVALGVSTTTAAVTEALRQRQIAL